MLLPLACFYGYSHCYSKSKLLVKEQVSLKNKIRFGCLSLPIFAVPVFYFDHSSANFLCSGIATKPFVLSQNI